MHHIAKYFRTQNLTVRNIRPDYYVLDYLYSRGLIGEEQFYHAADFKALLLIPNIHPAGWRPSLSEVREAETLHISIDA